MPNPDRAGLHDALFDLLTEVHHIASTLPLVPGGRLLLAADELHNEIHNEIHKAPSIASADAMSSALGACAPYLDQATNARLLDLGSTVAVLAGQP
jgi:hypothetical protein